MLFYNLNKLIGVNLYLFLKIAKLFYSLVKGDKKLLMGSHRVFQTQAKRSPSIVMVYTAASS